MAGGVTDLISAAYNSIPSLLPRKVQEVEKIIVKEVDMIAGRSRIFVRLAGLSGAAAVSMAAYGAHAFKVETEQDAKLKETFEIGNKMHLIHSVALLGAPLCRRPILAGTLFTLGMALFSGSCYAHALTGNMRVRYVTPYGGMMLILAWLSMIL